MKRVLFVCLGNICRSPMAEAIARHQAQVAGLQKAFEFDSAGTADYHVGQKADPRTLSLLKQKGIAEPSLARKVRPSDFLEFDLILSMDSQNQANLVRLGQGRTVDIQRILDYSEISEIRNVPDPYYGDESDFESVFDLLWPACQNLIARESNTA